MSVFNYIDKLGIEGKKNYILLAVAPKGKYPKHNDSQESLDFIKEVLTDDDKLIGLYTYGRGEILQDVAFRLFTIPLISDVYVPQKGAYNRNQSATKEKIESYFIIKTFNQTAGENESDHTTIIQQGKQEASNFLKRYPLEKYDVSMFVEDFYNEGVNFLDGVTFKEIGREYYFDCFQF